MVPSRRHPSLTLVAAALACAALAQRARGQPEVTQVPVDESQGRMMFEVIEITDRVGQPPRLAIWVDTEKAYSCVLPLSFQVHVTAHRVLVSGFTISSGGLCSDMVAPAEGVRHLDLPSGRYELVISQRDTTDTYRLDITDSSIATAGAAGSISAPKERLAWRYPRNSFALGCDAPNDASWICDDALRLLSLEAGIKPMSLPPTGSNPYGPGGIHFHIESPHLYRYARRADYDRAASDIKAFHDRVIGRRLGTIITVSTWLGETWETPAQ